MKRIKIAMFSLTSVHASPYINALPLYEKYDWVAASVLPKDRYIPDLKKIPSYVKLYETEEELLEAHPDLDAVILAGSNDLTYHQFKLCAEHGIKSVLLMKIPSMFMEQYEEMQQIAAEKGMVVQIELEMRGDQTVRRMKELCDRGAIGKLLSVQINNTTVVLPPELLPWVTNPEESYGKKWELKKDSGLYRGGCLTDHPHPFDLARYFTDSEFASIYADVSENFRDRYTIEEGVFVLAKMKNGVCVTIDPSYSRHENSLPPLAAAGPGWEGYPKRVEVNVILNGEKGTILGDCFHGGVYHTALPYHTFAYQYIGGARHYAPILDSFADSVINRTRPYINFELHKNNIKALQASYESIYSGDIITM